MKPEAILAQLRSVRCNGNGWTARCPAHKDRSPSLSIREGESGRVLLHCFAGCAVEDICTALGIKLSDLFTNRREMHKPGPRIVQHAKRQLIGLRSRLTPTDRERAVTVVLANARHLDAAIARALALAAEKRELVQIVLDGDAQ